MCRKPKVQIIDGNGCIITMSFNIPSPEAITRDPVRTTVSDVNCFGLKDGKVNYIAFGGTSPYRYTWVMVTPIVLDRVWLQENTSSSNRPEWLQVHGLIGYLSHVQIITFIGFHQNKTDYLPRYKDGQKGLKISGSNGGYKFIWVRVLPIPVYLHNWSGCLFCNRRGCKRMPRFVESNWFTWPHQNYPSSLPMCLLQNARVIHGLSLLPSMEEWCQLFFAINNGNSIPIKIKRHWKQARINWPSLICRLYTGH